MPSAIDIDNALKELFRRYFGTEPTPSFEAYFKERIPQEERLGTLRVMNSTLELLNKQGFGNMYSLIYDLANYSYGEWWFEVRDISDMERKNELVNDMAFVQKTAKRVWIKFAVLVNGVRSGELRISSMSPYSPANTTLKALLIKFINLNSTYAKNNPEETLINDLFDRIFRKAHGTLKMLSMGLAGEAYASWRTLHEGECLLALLAKDGKPLEHEYVKHLIYNNAFHDSIESEEDTNRIFEQIISERKARGLKSKDTKKFIEYGWLYYSSGYQELVEKSRIFNKYAVVKVAIKDKPTIYALGPGPQADHPDKPLYDKYKEALSEWDHDRLKNFRLNFRDGVEEMAGLRKYSYWYDIASEVTHSSSLFFYANDQYIFDLSTVALYQLCLRVAHLYKQVMAEKFENTPETQSMVNSLIDMCEAMNNDQSRRFERAYDTKLDKNLSFFPISGKTKNLGPTSEGTKPGPILADEENK